VPEADRRRRALAALTALAELRDKTVKSTTVCASGSRRRHQHDVANANIGVGSVALLGSSCSGAVRKPDAIQTGRRRVVRTGRDDESLIHTVRRQVGLVK
jgi:hypothetical protein